MIVLNTYNNKELASSKDIYDYLGISRVFSAWIKESLGNAKLILDKDFYTLKYKSTGGRPFVDYLLTERAAIRIVLQSRMPKSIKLESILIDTFKKRQNLDYLTPREAAVSFEFINCYKYVENQKLAFTAHKEYYLKTHPTNKYIFSEFAKHRSNITGWDKSSVNNAIVDYLKTHAGHNFTKVMRMSMSDKLSIMDVNEAIRVSVLDLLYSKGTTPEIANKFANMVKNISNEMNTLALRKNENNLFQTKENFNLKAIE